MVEKTINTRPSRNEVKFKEKVCELERLLKEKEKEIKRQKREVEEERIRVEILKKVPVHLYATLRMKYEAIEENSSIFEVEKMCRALELKAPNYYRWKRQKGINQEKKKKELMEIKQIATAFEKSGRTYGYRRIAKELEREGYKISEYKVRRLMRENGYYPEMKNKFKPFHKGKITGMYSNDRVNRNFRTKKQNEIWVGDITYIKTKIGWVYLAVVIDLYNREVIGYAISKKMDTELAKRALANAISKNGTNKGLIFHSDRGCQYASKGYQQMLAENGILASMSRPGCPYDNSCAESFFATIKKERIYRRRYDTIEAVKRDMFYYIELFYNRIRMHSLLGYMSPVEYRLSRP